jgi:two-component system, cell cycle sensor histidine kinase and response regulator CckA
MSFPDYAADKKTGSARAAYPPGVSEVDSYAILRCQNQVLELVARDAPLRETLDLLVGGIERLAPDVLGSILLLDGDGVHVRHGAAPSLPEAYLRAIDGLAIGPQAGSCGTAAFRREPVVVEDITVDPLWEPYRDTALGFGLRACWSTPIFDGERRVLGTFALYFKTPRSPTSRHLHLIDVTTHTAAIAIVHHRERDEARRREAQFAQAERIAHLGNYEWDARSNTVRRSPELCRVFGLEPDTFPPTFEAYLERVHPDDRADTRATIEASMQTRTPFAFEERIVRPDGSIRTLRSQGTWIGSDVDGTLRLVGICQDITERTLLEDQLRQAQKIDALGRLAGGVAHDFNNILTVIIGYGELIVRDLRAGDPLRDPLTDITLAARRAQALTQQLLAFGRRQLLQPRALDLSAHLAGSATMLKRLVGEDVELVTMLEPRLRSVKADPSQIDQVIINLVVNARDAMPRGGRLTIETRNTVVSNDDPRRQALLQPGPYVMVAVRDTGHAIDPKILPHIYEPFFTTKAPGTGTGLGLSTVYGIVKQSGGCIVAESAVGVGTTFSVYLPQIEAAASPDAPAPLLAEPARGVETVLVVEDDEAVRKFTCAALRRLGYQVLEAVNAGEALLACERQRDPIALLVTDVVMPHMSGPELAVRLHAIQPSMRVLYTSGYTDDAMVRYGLLDQSVTLLQKPFSTSVLGQRVRDVLDGPRQSS